jgi:hypothetical protein
MFCMTCGTQLPDEAQFCYKCGHRTDALAQQETKKPDAGVKSLDEILTPEVIERAAKKMAAKINEDPIRRYQYLLRSYEEDAQKFVSDEIMQAAIKIDTELDTLQDTTILNDPEIKKLRPVLYLYRGAMQAWQKFYRRWEADTNARKHNDVQKDFVSLGYEGIVKCISTMDLSEHSASVIYEHMGLRVWLEYRLLTDNLYFLLKQGYKLSDGKRLSHPYELLINRYGTDLVKLATDVAIKMYKSSS